MTLVELVHGVARANTPRTKEARRAFIDELKRHVPVHPVTETTAEIAGRLSGEQAAKGVTLPAADLLIGVSAIEQGYAVATLNIRHFKMIPGLHVISFLGSCSLRRAASGGSFVSYWPARTSCSNLGCRSSKMSSFTSASGGLVFPFS